MADRSRTKNAAEIQFKKAQQAEEGKKAMAEYEANAIAMRKKTERLKALRLARDAEEAAAEPAAPAKKKPGKKTQAKAKQGKAQGSTLTGWMKDQKEDGRNG
ncbi:MAG: hypothetical protein WD871_01105 [Xanthobacteraceae bacterium]